MQREIKFRVYDEKIECWIGGSMPLSIEHPLRRQGDTIQEFTGLIDKTGKDIYEGDFVNFTLEPEGNSYENFQVLYNPELASFVFTNKETQLTMANGIDKNSLKVTGNIFDNQK